MDKEAFLRSLLPRMDYVKCKECNKTLIAPMVRPLSLIQDWGFSTMVTLHIACSNIMIGIFQDKQEIISVLNVGRINLVTE